jgi:hypothetical protein
MEMASPDSGNSFRMQGRFMYADYSPLEDDRNLVEVIKEFVALVSKLGRLDVNNRKLASLAADSDKLRQDIISAIKHINTNTSYTMEKFHDEHADVLSNDLLTKGSALLLDTKRSLSELLATTESGFDEQHTKYREKISSRISENNSTASTLVQSWLSADHRNLPRIILSHLGVTIGASLDKTGKGYDIMRTASSSAIVDAGANQKDPGALQFTYSFRIDPSEIEFWNFRRNVADLGIKDLMLPTGMRAPVSEKIKQKFRFGSRKDSEVMKEPEFVKADGYFLASATLQDHKTLVIELAAEPLKIENGDLFRITYDVGSLAQQKPAEAAVPKVDYVTREEGNLVAETDLLHIAEVKAASDVAKIRLLGAAVLSRSRILQEPQLVSARGKLVELRIRNDKVVIPADLEEGRYDSLFSFLESIAESYAPFVKQMQARTPVKGELTLKEELGGGQRKEYSVRSEELRSQLGETENGRAIAYALGLNRTQS